MMVNKQKKKKKTFVRIILIINLWLPIDFSNFLRTSKAAILNYGNFINWNCGCICQTNILTRIAGQAELQTESFYLHQTWNWHRKIRQAGFSQIKLEIAAAW